MKQVVVWIKKIRDVGNPIASANYYIRVKPVKCFWEWTGEEMKPTWWLNVACSVAPRYVHPVSGNIIVDSNQLFAITSPQDVIDAQNAVSEHPLCPGWSEADEYVRDEQTPWRILGQYEGPGNYKACIWPKECGGPISHCNEIPLCGSFSILTCDDYLNLLQKIGQQPEESDGDCYGRYGVYHAFRRVR